MTAVAFDTLKLARKLRDTAEMTQVQAEGVADALAEAMSGAELATKPDLGEVKAELKGDIAEVKAELKGDIADVKAELAAVKAELRADLVEVEHHLEAKIANVLVALADAKTDILRWVFAAVVGQTALIVTLLKVWR